MAGAFETGVYRNVFLECGIPEEEIEKKVSATFRSTSRVISVFDFN